MRVHRIAPILAPLLPGLLRAALIGLLLLAGPALSPGLAAPLAQLARQPDARTVEPAPGDAMTPGTPPAGGTVRVPEPERGRGRLAQRLQQWPAWQLPAPLQRAGREAPRWPDWFAGEWWVQSESLPLRDGDRAVPAPPWRVRFRVGADGGVVADRAFNAASLARALLPDTPLTVQDDRADPRRQLARLGPDQLLETTLLAWRLERPAADLFLNDELSLEVLHGSGPPRLSRVETLGRWQRRDAGCIEGEQWQARYAAPGEGLSARSLGGGHLRLRLVRAVPGSGPAS
jgi:hypothetical protein